MRQSFFAKPIAIATFTTLSMATAVVARPVLQAPTPSPGPTLAQLGSTQAYIPMKHGPCDNGTVDCLTHKLATQSGNLNMKAKIGMAYPAGRTVTFLSYQPQGADATTVINSNTNQQSRSLNITMQPFSQDDLEQAGQTLLGGDWPIPGQHPTPSKTVKKTLKKSIRVVGRCSGWANAQTKNFPVTVTATFEDKSFPIPPEGYSGSHMSGIQFGASGAT